MSAPAMTSPNPMSAAGQTMAIPPSKIQELVTSFVKAAPAEAVEPPAQMPDSVRRRIRRERAQSILVPILGSIILLIVWEAISKTGQAAESVSGFGSGMNGTT